MSRCAFGSTDLGYWKIEYPHPHIHLVFSSLILVAQAGVLVAATLDQRDFLTVELVVSAQ